MKGGTTKTHFWESPRREVSIFAGVGVVLLFDFFWPVSEPVFWAVTVIGLIPILIRGAGAVYHFHFRVTIDTFNLFALMVVLSAGEIRGAAFIVLLVTSANLLAWHIARQTHQALHHFLMLKPVIAHVDRGVDRERIPVEHVAVGDLVVVGAGQVVPVDGMITAGDASMDEMVITGESMPIERSVGAQVLAGTTVREGKIKVRTLRIAKESIREHLARFMHAAREQRSGPERLADRFATVFLPIVLLIAAVTYLRTENLHTVAAIFLVACADDLSVPLAVTAALGRAARRGVVIKGGAVFDVLARLRTVVVRRSCRFEHGATGIRQMAALGVRNAMMVTDEREVTAKRIATAMGIKKIRSHLSLPESIAVLKRIRERPIAIVTDVHGDPSLLAHADVGVVMGHGGPLSTLEAADVIVLNHNFMHVPEMVRLARRTVSVLEWNIVFWILLNVVGFWLVLSGVIGPIAAAAYNFATDFLPLLNSARLFGGTRKS